MPKLSDESVQVLNGKIILFRRKRSPLWQARFRIGRKWIRTSTKKEKLKEAQGVAIEAYHEAKFKEKHDLPVTSRKFRSVAEAVKANLQKAIDAGEGRYGTEFYNLKWKHISQRDGTLLMHVKGKTGAREAIPRANCIRYLRRIQVTVNTKGKEHIYTGNKAQFNLAWMWIQEVKSPTPLPDALDEQGHRAEVARISKQWNHFLRHEYGQLGHYFRNLYAILTYVDASTLPIDKDRYGLNVCPSTGRTRRTPSPPTSET